MKKTKQFTIPKQLFVQAFKLVKENAGSAGIDRQSLKVFEKDLKDNLYKLWNRMSSGSYFPPPVKAIPIPKKLGGERILGVPTVGDRICQTVVKLVFEPQVEKMFLPDSYGYRPNKSALDAIDVTRKRCWNYNWVIEFDIKGLFDNISHDLLMKAVHKHTNNKWVVLYIERWIKASMQAPDKTLIERNRGVPQGGVISPVLSNLFLHYVFDVWMQRNYSENKWCRYTDDGLIHCKTQNEATRLLVALNKRFTECLLELHQDKTKIIYCKDENRKGDYINKSFDFLGFTFRARGCKSIRTNSVFANFTPAVSNNAATSMRATTRKYNVRNRTDLELQDIARWFNTILQGWLNYYGTYSKTAMYPVLRHFNKTLVAWAMRKYKPLTKHKIFASKFMERISVNQPHLFVHWKIGMIRTFV